MFKKILRFFDRLEDKNREVLSRYPIIYALIGGISIVIFWRGVWYMADSLVFMTGLFSVIASSVVLLLTGLFVSFFIGDRIILSGLKREKKLAEKTETEVKTEIDILSDIHKKLENIEKDLKEIKKGGLKEETESPTRDSTSGN